MRDHDTRRHSRHDAEPGDQHDHDHGHDHDHDHGHEDWHEHEHHKRHEHIHEGSPDFEDRGWRPRGGPGGPRGGGRRGQFRGGPAGWGPGGFRGQGPWAGGPWAGDRRMRGPWAWRDQAGEALAGAAELRAMLGQLKMAVLPLALTGTEDQQARAREILTSSRTALYRILAEEADATSAPETATATEPSSGPETTAGEQGN
jgi:hypothetical protein